MISGNSVVSHWTEMKNGSKVFEGGLGWTVGELLKVEKRGEAIHA